METTRSRFEIYKDHEILVTDYTHLSGKAFVEAITRAHAFLLASMKSGIHEVVDVTGSYADSAVMDALKKTAAEERQYVSKRAVVGVQGMQRILLEAVNLFANHKTVPLGSMEQAKEWLVKQRSANRT